MKKWIVCVLTLCMLAVFAGALAEFPVTLVDQTGREVSISEQPERIVSGYYISTSACIALGLEDCMVGVEAKADTRNIYTLAAPSLLELPSVGTAKAFDLEACLATEPDLVILPARLADSADALTEFGIPVLLVSPEDDELLSEMIALIGEATGTQERAYIHQKYMTHLISELKPELTEIIRQGIEKGDIHFGHPAALAEIVLIVLTVKLDNTLIPSTREEIEETMRGLISLLEKGTENPAGSLNFLTA